MREAHLNTVRLGWSFKTFPVVERDFKTFFSVFVPRKVKYVNLHNCWSLKIVT